MDKKQAADKGGGQILICVAGRGFYQEWGKVPVEMKPSFPKKRSKRCRS